MENSIKQGKPTKILIMGLDNSGKTSILISLKKNTNILSFFALRPTKGLSIERFEEDQNIAIWDLGGQKRYRDGYFKDMGKYIKDTSKIVFVIDVQDVKRYSVALEYLRDIIKTLVKYDSIIDFSIYLHKYDPNLEKQDEFKDIDSLIESKLVKEIKNSIPSKFNYNIFKTTIYTIFEKTLY